MRTIILSIALFISQASFAAKTTIHTLDDSPLVELEEGDEVVVCNEEVCRELPIIKKVNVKNKSELQKVLNNAKRLAAPGLVLATMATLPGVDGGPALSAVCGTVCGVISTCGCTAGSVVMLGLSPAASALYASACGYLITTGGIAGCTAACLAMPTP